MDGGTLRAGAPPAQGQIAVVLVHGRDQDAAVMRDLLERLPAPPAATCLLPEAAGRSWYAARYTDGPDLLEPDVGRALATVEAALTEARQACPGGPLVLVGFSQGACLAAERLARRGRTGLDGVALLTGAFIGPHPGTLREPAHGVAGLRVEMVSSEHDDWVLAPHVRTTAASLRAAGADVRLTMTDEPEHRIDDVAVAAVARLLADVRRSGDA